SLLLADGIGDTIRVSLTADPLEEVWVAWNILRELGLREPGPRLISCPMCGRCREDLLPMVTRLRHHLRGIKAPLTVAVMGCEVNGPGEARCADIGLACGRDCALLFRRGHPHVKLAWHDAMDALIEQIHLDSARWRLG
ncbi:flavodoxin-dependent (E)-4-hydroxy-3-methylbut-2-enyl-diphosphate synthase, partial [bacterium]|nr:flavodoxin-dependent (E)-4-hydroxy-3-methylbut-2-enyl-diphosphate synthase [candidate division CSSED10-310 bacterium]